MTPVTSRLEGLRSALLGVLLAALPAVAAGDLYQLAGKVVASDGQPTRADGLSASLHAMSSPFSTRTEIGPDGQFKFGKLPEGVYTLILFARGAAPLRRTISIGPSVAGRNRTVSTTVVFDPKPLPRRPNTVSVTQLAIPEAARQEFQKGLEHLERREVDRATRSFEKALEIAPQFAGAHSRLGMIAYQSDRYDDAERHFRAALDINRNLFGALVNLGATLLAAGKTEESLRVNLRAAAMRPEDPAAQSQAGYSYFHLGRLEEAETRLKTAKRLDPAHFSFPQLILAEIYGRREEWSARIGELEEFLKHHPDSPRSPDVRRSLDLDRARLERIGPK
jgi:tetratricopeptide (TPR) repeat protein